MAALDPCRDEVMAALGGRELSKNEEKIIVRHAGKLKARIDAGGDPGKVFDNFMQERAAAVEARKLTAAQNELARVNANARFESAGEFGTKAPAQVLQSMVISSLKQFSGSMDSLGKRITRATEAATSDYRTDLRKANLSDYAFGGKDQENIWKAFDALNRKEDPSQFGTNAVAVAKIMQKHTTAMWQLKQAANIPIGKIEDWVGPQMHDPYAIGKAGKNWLGSDKAADAYVTDVMQNIGVNWDKTFGGELAAADDSLKASRLRSLWADFHSGNHLRYGTSIDPAKNRELYLDGPKAQYAYNQRYGGGRTLAENVDGWLERSARDVEIAKMFGTDPDGFVKRLANDQLVKIKESGTLTPAEMAKAQKDMKAVEDKIIDRYLPSLTGQLGIPETAVGHLAYNANQLINALAVGAATPVLIGDLPLFFNTMARNGGQGMKRYFSYLGDTLGHMAKLSPEEQIKAASLAEILLSDSTAPLMRSNAGEYVAGGIKKFEQWEYKKVGHTAWTDRIRTAGAAMHGAYHWFERDKAFEALDPELKDGFERFGIGPKEWDIIRKADPQQVLSNVKAFGPAQVRKMDLESFGPLAGAEPSEAALGKIRTEVADKYRNFIGHMADSVTTTRNDELKAISSIGMSKNSLGGWLVSSFNSLKNFTYKLTRDQYGPMMARDRDPKNVGWATITKNFMLGNGGVPSGRVAMAKFVANNTLFGVMIYQLSLIRNGQQPVIPDTPEKAADLLWHGFVRQGAGLYGDMLAQQLERPDKSFFDIVGSSFSPLVGDVADLADATKRVASAGAQYATNSEYGGDKFWKALRKSGGLATKAAYGAVPGTNFVWSKFATDWYVKDNLLDAMNPGYKDRLIKRAQKNDTPYLLGPSP